MGGFVMPIEFRCVRCDKLLRTGDDTAGRQAKCPSCGETVTVPTDAAVAVEVVPGDNRRHRGSR